MKKEAKKISGNTLDTFRKLSIANTVLTYLGFVILGFVAGYLIAMGIKNMPEKEAGQRVSKITIIVWCVMSLIALISISSLSIGIAQSVLSKKVGTVGKLNYKGIISILIIFLGLGLIAAVATDYYAYITFLATGQSARLYFVIGGIAGGAALFMLGAAIFNTFLCAKTGPAKK